MRKLIYLLILSFPLSLYAQRSITGKVTDSEGGIALSGVSVSVEGNAQTGTTSNADGAYSINVPSGANALVFSFVGKKTVIEQINGRSVINIQLAPGTDQMDNVVVVGYASKKKESLTGAISNITAKEIQTSTNPSIAQKLQGKVAGLNIRQTGGQPGVFDNTINIRGLNLGAPNNEGNPLYVIDGIVRNDQGAFQRLNPDDVESINVIKDGSGAVYGIGAANGVILVTTKQGTRGKPQFNYSAVVGVNKPTNNARVASSGEFIEAFGRSRYYELGTPQWTQTEVEKWKAGTEPGYENVDWYGMVIKNTAMQTQHNLSVNGGSDKVMYYVGAEYYREEGLNKFNDIDYNRVNLRSNLTADLAKTLRARVLISGRWDKARQPGTDFFSLAKWAMVSSPLERPYANNNPEYLGNVNNGFENPLAVAQRDISGYTDNESRVMQNQLELRWSVPFVKGLSITGTGSYDINNPMSKNLQLGFYTYSYDAATNTYTRNSMRRLPQRISNRFDNNNDYTLRLQTDYKVQINQDHDISLTAVVEQRKNYGRWISATRFYTGGFYTMDILGSSVPATDMQNDGNESIGSSLNYIGRASYGFRNKYFLDAAFNYQGSYRYNPDGQRWGFFPVISGSWRISEEGFIKNHVPVISNLKLRGSYGILGTNTGNAWQYLPGVSLTGNGWWEFANGTAVNTLPSPVVTNPDLTWVENVHSDIALEVGLFHNKLTFMVDLYERVNRGSLATRAQTIPNTYGASLPQENLNKSRNRGIDIEVGHNGNINKVRYTISGVFNYNRYWDLYVERAPFLSQRDVWLNSSMGRLNNRTGFYLLDGQYQNMDEIANNGYPTTIQHLPGDFRYVDVNEDGRLDGDDGRNWAWGSTPLFNFGLTLSAQWKGFDANILFQGSGGYTFRFSEMLGEMFAFRGNIPAFFLDSWHQSDIYATGTTPSEKSEWIPGKWPVTRSVGVSPGDMYNASPMWNRRSDYVRLKNLELGYTFDAAGLHKLGIQKLRVYANGFNLVTWTKDPTMKLTDPEKGSGVANTGLVYPIPKNYNFGLTLTF